MTEQVPQQPAPSLQSGPSDLPNSPPHEHRTHTSPERISAFQKLSLFCKLTLNKEIEQANLTHERKHIDHLMNLAANPTDGSPAASLLTIEPEEIDQLCVPSFFEKFKDLISTSLLLTLSKLLKKCEGNSLDSADYKHVCTLGTREPVECSLGIIWEVVFDRVLYHTEMHVPILLNFFLRDNLCYISDMGSALPKIKVNPPLPDPATSSVCIIDVPKLITKFGDNLAMSCSKWSEAAENYFVF